MRQEPLTIYKGRQDINQYCRINKISIEEFNPPVTINPSDSHTAATICEGLFAHCTSFNRPVRIPTGAISISDMFNNCSIFNQPIEIPDSVMKMNFTFQGCSTFNQPVKLPKNLTKAVNTFCRCYRFNNKIKFPSSDDSMLRQASGMFAYCVNLNQEMEINFNRINGHMIIAENMFCACNSLNNKIKFNTISPFNITDLMLQNPIYRSSINDVYILINDIQLKLERDDFCKLFDESDKLYIEDFLIKPGVQIDDKRLANILLKSIYGRD